MKHWLNAMGSSDKKSSDFLQPAGDCVIMQDATNGSIFWRQLQSLADQDKWYKWHTMEEIIAKIPDDLIPGITGAALQWQLRNNESDFLHAMVNKRLIEIDDGFAKFRIHVTHHKDGYTFVD